MEYDSNSSKSGRFVVLCYTQFSHWHLKHPCCAVDSRERRFPPTSPTKQNFVSNFLCCLRIYKLIRIRVLRSYFDDSMGGKISVQPHTTLCIQFLNRENNDKNNTLPLGKQICFIIVWGCVEILPYGVLERRHFMRSQDGKNGVLTADFQYFQVGFSVSFRWL